MSRLLYLFKVPDHLVSAITSYDWSPCKINCLLPLSFPLSSLPFLTDLFTILSLTQQLVYICFSSLFVPSFHSLARIYTSLFTHHCVPSLIPFENHLIRKACKAHMPPPTTTLTSCHPCTPPSLLAFFDCIMLAFRSYLSCASVVYLTNYTERLEAAAQPGKQHNSCKDINIHPGINIRSVAQVGQTVGQAIECRTPGKGCLDEKTAALT